jgi:hypothetical protein
MSLARDITAGAAAGVLGGAVMEAIREPLVARGRIRWTPPRRITYALRGSEEHPVFRNVVHLGYAGAQGCAYAMLERRLWARRPSPAAAAGLGAGWGTVIWASNLLALLPATDVMSRPAHQPTPRMARELGIHLVFGVVCGIAFRALRSQPTRTGP